MDVWIRAAAICGGVVVIFAILGLFVGAPPSTGFIELNERRIAEFRAAHPIESPGTLRVVMLGNSRLKYATVDDATMRRVAAEQNVQSLEVFRVVANWAVFSNFEPLLDEIETLDADVYVLQLELVVEDMTELFKHILFLQHVRWKISGEGSWAWFEPDPEQFDTPCDEAPGAAADHRNFRGRFRLKTDPNSASALAAQEFIRNVTAKGARVVLVSIPKTSHLEELYPSIGDELRAISGRLSRETGGTQLLVYPGGLSDDYYCDVSHMNWMGAEAYLHWLLPNLASLRSVAAQ
ncbi:MAG: hypothetical protein ACREEE_12665 [Dongiaceae bacterium]